MSRPAFLLLLPATCALASVSGRAAVDFAREVQPILAENCFHCHGPDAADRQGGLRLDTREGALRGGKSGVPALVEKNPAESELLARILSTDEEEMMPPPKEKKSLTAAQKDTLRRWITEGAPYARHWAFVPPVKAPLPAAAPRPAAPAQAIDALVAARLPAAGLAPAPAADPATLCRRLHLDLIGLPPTPAEVESFSAAVTAQGLASAVEALVTRLLASERYGEKWARVWLDAARYADSNGYEKDLPREQWAWRDWVIRALNQDQPYDQFLVEQIAGDLLPGATQDQIVATGFLRNGMLNEEGAIIPEQFRIEGVFDRLDCIGKATLGLTLQCAQCHTHKFDPITHDDYFGLFAFLNNTYEAQSWVYTPEQQQQLAKLRTDLAAVDAKLKQAHPQWSAQLTAWEETLRTRLAAIAWTPVVATEMGSTSGLNHPVQLPDRSIITEGHPTTKGDIFVIATPDLAGATGFRLEALCSDDLPFRGPGRSLYGTWAITELEVTAQVPGSDKWEKVALQNATADFSEAPRALEREWDAAFDREQRRTLGPVAFMIDGNDNTAWRADRGPGRRNTESVAVVQFAQPLAFPAGTKLRFLLRYNHSGDDNGRHNTMLGRCRLALTTAPDPRAEAVDYAAQLALATPADARTPAQTAAVFAAWRASDAAFKSFTAEADALWKKYPAAATSVLHLAERTTAEARTTRLLERGAWDKPLHAVAPHVPGALHPLPADAPGNRLALARWIADPRSPLTARVAVNRVWQALFGTGLVDTPEDFGTRTPVPLHQDLLDWLAVDFMEHGWSQKRLLRAIVASHTYQQASRAGAAELERDPRNAYLARGPRFRADAEVVRDIALSVAGLLSPKIGGPSIFPPVPENVLAYNFFKVTYWDVPTGPDRYRRSLYLFRKRSMPDPMLSAFDAPNGDFACVRRVRSNTPLAALTALNEPIMVEAAQAFALRIWREGGASDADRAAHAYRLATARSPRPAERTAVLELVAATRDRLRRGELKAGDLAFSELTRAADLPADATPIDLAAWTVAARVILNLDETLTKN